VLKAQLEGGFQNQLEKQESAGNREELTFKNLRKEVEKIQEQGEDYEFGNHNDESSEAKESDMSTGLTEEGERKRQLEGKSEGDEGSRKVRFRAS